MKQGLIQDELNRKGDLMQELKDKEKQRSVIKLAEYLFTTKRNVDSLKSGTSNKKNLN